MGTINGRGDIVSPGIIYPYVRLPNDIASSVPEGYFIGMSESGWMKSECFFEYLANAFIPWLRDNNIKLPVILFVDGHTTHLTLQVSTLCEENRIILYLLPPNTTHILQPADVGAFKSLKQRWRKAVHEFQRSNPNRTVRREHMAPLLKQVLDSISPDVLKSGFEATGLCPLNPYRPDYSKCLDIDIESEGEEEDHLERDILSEERV